jgi:hypothetical protein
MAVVDALRAAQGVAAPLIWSDALTWVVRVSPRAQRGEMLGSAIAAAIVGVGRHAGRGRRHPIRFDLITCGSVLIVALRCQWSVLLEARPHLRPASFSHGPLVMGIWIVTLEAITLCATNALISPRLSRVGASSVLAGARFVLAAGVLIFVCAIRRQSEPPREHAVPMATGGSGGRAHGCPGLPHQRIRAGRGERSCMGWPARSLAHSCRCADHAVGGSDRCRLGEINGDLQPGFRRSERASVPRRPPASLGPPATRSVLRSGQPVGAVAGSGDDADGSDYIGGAAHASRLLACRREP